MLEEEKLWLKMSLEALKEGVLLNSNSSLYFFIRDHEKPFKILFFW